jgi:MoaA/NifB/PqqE/SkfB family radical SAM enzyme
MLDIFQKYNDMFFMVYTNGTLISEEVAGKLARSANVTPAISVEGFEKETDQRRGQGTFKKILKAFENLRKAGVPFGISATATSKNADLLLTDEFYDFYFKEQGASYMWQFQIMPIGRGKDELELMVSPEKRLKLFRKWEKLLAEKKYCLADFWNSGMLTRGCIAYGRGGGYFYVDWHGNVTPCAFIPYYVDNIYDLYNNAKTLSDALFSDFMKNGRKWQLGYGLGNRHKPGNWLMPCSIRDHYEIFRNSVLTENAKPEDRAALEALESKEYFKVLQKYDQELQSLTEKIWENEYLGV